MRKVVLRTIIIVFVTYLIVGSVGYVTFSNQLLMNNLQDINKANGVVLLAYGFDTEGNSIQYPILVVICILMMCMAIIVAEPLNVKPAKDGLKDIFWPRRSDENGQPIETNESMCAHFLLVFFTVYSAVVVAVFAKSAQTVMNILGSSFYSLICFIFPGFFYLKLHEKEPVNKDKVLVYLMMLSMGAFGIWNTVENIIHPTS